MNNLKQYGWSDRLTEAWNASNFPHGYLPARITADFGRKYTVVTPDQQTATLAGTLTHSLTSTDMPKVGDWVAIEQTDGRHVIQAVLPRKTEIVRGHIGRIQTKQVVAANIDIAFVMQALNNDYSLERLERYIFQLSQQNIIPIVLLNKADKSSENVERQQEVKSLGVECHIISALHDTDVSVVEAHITPDSTAVIMGSSGAGKSTLTNRLLGSDTQATAAVRKQDGKGRHTTIHRELFLLPSGGMLVDTPGIRELQLWGSVADLHEVFDDIKEAIDACKFTNCTHGSEPGCVVQARLRDGTLDARRYRTYTNFVNELKSLQDYSGLIAERRAMQSKATAKRRQARQLRYSQDKDDYTV